MSTKNLIFENFINKKVNSKLKKFLKDLISSKSEVINSLSNVSLLFNMVNIPHIS